MLVELAELFVATVPHTDWAMFAKNGTDVTTLSLMVARAHTRKRAILAAAVVPRGRSVVQSVAAWAARRGQGPHPLLPVQRPARAPGAAAAEVGDGLAGVIVTPFRHDAGHDQEDVDPSFARGLRALCDATGTALILDDVRAGLRLDPGEAGSRSACVPT